jgi:exopolyphosphatase/guanosine-5'-triphosphate,3'-diphosphate pyrophosphatase
MKRVAIIDMGTNTFNLLIVSVNGDNSFQILHSGKLPVKLGEGGINQKFIAPPAFQRGIEAIGEHLRTILLHGAGTIYAFATSATRNATNGRDFVNEINKLFGIKVDVIEGDREAELIYLGVRQAIELGDEKSLIIDIGGGSNELIIADGKQHYWKRSYDLGISRLLQMFNPTDPIFPSEIEVLENYFTEQMHDLDEMMQLYKPIKLIGSSGSFDTYRSILSAAGRIAPNGNPSVEIPFDEYIQLHKKLIASTVEQRKQIPGMEPVRVEMIGVASIFTHYLIRHYDLKSLYQSTYALKEGAIWSILNNG